MGKRLPFRLEKIEVHTFFPPGKLVPFRLEKVQKVHQLPKNVAA
jgi:hypothetical protein